MYIFTQMPLPAAEKMRRRRQKLKEEGRYEEYKKTQKVHVKNSRKRKQENEQTLSNKVRNKINDERKRNVRERVAKCRRLKKAKEQNRVTPIQSGETIPTAFKTTSSLGKAAARVRRALPKSPRKTCAVIRKLYTDHVEPINIQQKSGGTALSPTTEKAVVEFYLRDDISRQAPGRKDVL